MSRKDNQFSIDSIDDKKEHQKSNQDYIQTNTANNNNIVNFPLNTKPSNTTIIFINDDNEEHKKTNQSIQVNTTNKKKKLRKRPHKVSQSKTENTDSQSNDTVTFFDDNNVESFPTELVYMNAERDFDRQANQQINSNNNHDNDNNSESSDINFSLRCAFGLLAGISGYGRGVVSMVRFFMLWQLYQIAQGKKIESFEAPELFIEIALPFAALLAVNWVVNGYNNSTKLFKKTETHGNRHEGRHQHQSYCQQIIETLKENIAAIPIALIGAAGHSFVIHRAVAELSDSFADHSGWKKIFEVSSWIIPGFCAIQYLLSEGQHIGHALKRSLYFDDYSEGMRFAGKGYWQRFSTVLAVNTAAIVTALAWGALEFTECYLILRKLFQSQGVTLGNEIAVMVATFFGLLGGFSSFIDDGERFKCFMTYPFREPNRKNREIPNSPIKSLPLRKIPKASAIFHGPHKYWLMVSGAAALISSIGLGVISFTGVMQFANVFNQFYNQEKPLWAPWKMALGAGIITGIIPTWVFFITQGRYIWKEWRHSHTEEVPNDALKSGFYDDHRHHSKDKKPRYLLQHLGLDFLQLALIVSIKLVIELTVKLKIPFLLDIAIFYFASSVVALTSFILEEISNLSKPIQLLIKSKEMKNLRRGTQVIAQLLVPLVVGVLSEWALHGWTMKEPVSEVSRLNFAHITGTLIAAISTIITKRMIDTKFVTYSNGDNKQSRESENIRYSAAREFFWRPRKTIVTFGNIASSIYKGALNFSVKEKVFYTFVSVAVGYFCWETSNVLKQIGKEGTRFFSIGGFSSKFVGQAAFWCNVTLSSYLIMSTILNVRNSYYHYKLAREKGMSIPWIKKAMKLSIALLLALAASVMMVTSLKNAHGFYNACIIGGVNMVLNYIGATTLENIVIFSFTYVKNSFYKKYRNKKSIAKLGKKIINLLTKATCSLRALSNDNEKWNNLDVLNRSGISANYIKYIADSRHIIEIDSASSLYKQKNIAGKLIAFVIHLIMQILDKITLCNYLLSNYSKNPLNIAVFTLYIGLSSYIVYTTVDKMINSTKTMFRNLIDFIKKPRWSKEHWINLLILLPTTALIISGYFLAYVSSDSLLKFNTDYNSYNWKDWNSQYPTAITLTMFNGYGFFIIISTISRWLTDYFTYLPQKRNVLDKHQKTCGFFQSLPHAVDDISVSDSKTNFLPIL